MRLNSYIQWEDMPEGSIAGFEYVQYANTYTFQHVSVRESEHRTARRKLTASCRYSIIVSRRWCDAYELNTYTRARLRLWTMILNKDRRAFRTTITSKSIYISLSESS